MKNFKSRENDKGSILIYCLVITLVLTMGAMLALNITDFELRNAANTKESKIYFRNAEMGMKFAIANFRQIYANSDGSGNILYSGGDGGILFDGNTGTGGLSTLGNTSLRDMNPTEGFVVFDYAVNPGAQNPIPIARVEIRSILKTSSIIASSILTPEANSPPLMSHVGPAPELFDPDSYRSRRFAITSTAYDATGTNLTNITIQSGTTIAALKDNIKQYNAL